MVSFTLRQVTSIVSGPAYQVTNSVVGYTDTDPNVFVFEVTKQVFNHYAIAADMEQWPTTRELAIVQGAAYYRASVLVRTWNTVAEMNEDLADTARRVQLLADDLTAQQGSLVTDRTTVIQGS